MKFLLRALLFVNAAIFCSTGKSYAQLYSLETKNLQLVYYSKAHEFVVPHIARCFENALSFDHAFFSYTPSEKVTLILQDFGDYASGGANTVPFNLIGIGIAPFNYVYETMPAVERMNFMMIHELIHIVTMDKPAPKDRFFRSLFFGKVAPISESPPSMLYAYLTGPRWYTPRWFVESIAVFMETWMNGGVGRALGAYDEMVFRTMVRDGVDMYDVVGLESEGTKVDFQVGANSYLYGTRFVSYLALQYGPEKLVQWFTQSDSSKGYFASQFSYVYGSSIDEEWQKWIAWEHLWQKANLDSIGQYPVTRFRPLTGEALGSVSRAFYDPSARKLYAAINYPGQTPHLASIDIQSGSIEKLHDVRGGAVFYVTSLAYDSSTQSLFYTSDNNHWRDLNALDIKTGRSRLLIKDVRTGDFAFNRADKSLWGVRHFNGISTLVRIPFPYDDWNQVHSFDYGRDIFDIDISPDGSRLTGAVAEINGQQSLISMDVDKLLNGDHSYEVLYDFGNSTPASFVFSNDGRYLFGSSYYSGVSNIVRYDFGTKKMEWVSNCESGLFRPLPISDDSLIAFHYTGKGFVPVVIANQTTEDVSAINYLGQEIVETHPVVKSWLLSPPSTSTGTADSTGTFSEYIPMNRIKLASAYPVVEGYKKFPAYGVRLNFSDPTFLHSMDLTASYTQNQILRPKERMHVDFNYSFWEWKISGTYNGGDFYDLFGPTRTSRRGYSARLQYRKYLLFEEPEKMSYRLTLAGYGDLERLPDYQNISASFDKFYSFDARLNYSLLVRSLGAVEEEAGIQWELVSHTNYVNEKFFPLVSGSLDYGVLLPLNHSSLWLRTSAGFSPGGKRQEPFANFFFGGFGNNWVDHQEVWRYRQDYSFPGVELNSVGGTTYGKAILEWTLPPIRFRRFGVPALYCNWTRISFFSSGIFTNLDSKPDRRSLLNLGAQMDFRLVLFSSLESTFSLGYAGAVEKGRRLDKEFMISLKVLK